jgi:hypothetical protein
VLRGFNIKTKQNKIKLKKHMVQIFIILAFIILAKIIIKEEQKEYKQRCGMTKDEFLAMRKRMNPEFKITLKQWLQDLSKN